MRQCQGRSCGRQGTAQKPQICGSAAHRHRTALRSSTQCRASSLQEAVDEGESLVEVSDYVLTHSQASVPGVYAIYDTHRAPQLISYSEDMFNQIKAHQRDVDEDLCAFVRAKVFANAAMATPQNMEREAAHWIETEGGVLPPGNGAECSKWGGQGELCSSSSGSDDERRASSESATVVSPFSQATVHRSVGAAEAHPKEMTVASVDKVLNEIRGYLFADGGDIEVVKVEDGNVYVRFEGNCATCGSQETTMAMGVTRSLRAAFGTALREVVPLPAAEGEGAGDGGVTVAAVNSLLDLLRPAVKGYGGRVEAKSVEGGVVGVEYEGPEPIWVGVRSAIRDKFPDVAEVTRL